MMVDPRPIPIDVSAADAPCVDTTCLDVLWFQVGGTICNLRCHHCFISCSPENDKFGFMSLKTCRRYLEQSKPLGVREYYFTGGEPFANPEICDILEAALRYGPVTVLTNATLMRDRTLARLAELDRATDYSIEIRVSLDGYSAEMNDPIRGEGTFEKAMEGTRRLVQSGFLPIMTITRTWCGEDEIVLAGFRKLLADNGYTRPRLKILPLIKLGAEVERGGGYCADSHLTKSMLAEYDQSNLVCRSARLVTTKGVWVCPILLDAGEARMGDALEETVCPYPLRHQACTTCFQYGAICSNIAGAASTTTDA